MGKAASQTAARLREREQQLRREREARAEEVLQAVGHAVRAHVKPPAIVWVIGSLAWGGFGPQSDVDLVLSGVEATTALILEVEIARVAHAEVDLLTLEDLPASFRERVISTGVRLV